MLFFPYNNCQVLEEADLDDDGMLSYIEFEHVISRAPDFLKLVANPNQWLISPTPTAS